MLERWPSQFQLIQRISSHYKTAAPLSFALFESIQKNERLDIGLFYQRQIFMALLFLEMYTFPTISLKELVIKNGRERIFLFDKKIAPDFLCSVVHVPPQEYGPKYYSYLWSLLYAIEMFSYIEKEGLCNSAVGMKLRTEVLEKGGSVDSEKLITDFLGFVPEGAEGFKRYIMESQ